MAGRKLSAERLLGIAQFASSNLTTISSTTAGGVEQADQWESVLGGKGATSIDDYFGRILRVGMINIAQTARHKFGQSCIRLMDQITCSPVLSADPKPKRK